jgi:dTDP-4-dehydrorhamnose 3,5-epimerase
LYPQEGFSQQFGGATVEASAAAITGLVLFTPTPHVDQRGFFSRTFDVELAQHAGVDPSAFVLDCMSRAKRGVVRGLHLRVGAGEGKLVRCSAAEIFDVVIDLRPGSPTYWQWLSFDLDGIRQRSIYVPSGCAHGFQALTDTADTSYRINRVHDPSEDLTIAFDDPTLAIPWPLSVTAMCPEDRAARPLDELSTELARINADR